MYEADKNFASYKDKPLVRSGNTIYYGSMIDDYITMLQIKDTVKVGDEEVAHNIAIQLMRTGLDVKPQDIVVKRTDREGLAAALEVADIWLRRALSDQA